MKLVHMGSSEGLFFCDNIFILYYRFKKKKNTEFIKIKQNKKYNEGGKCFEFKNQLERILFNCKKQNFYRILIANLIK